MTDTPPGLLVPPAGEGRRFDAVALGEVMLRFDPGPGRVRTARRFDVWEGGGEYNVVRALRKVFGLSAAVLTALPDNELGRLAEDLMLQGGVDLTHVVWRPYDGLGASTRLGLNFVERGYGVRAALGCSDRANSAASQLGPDEIDWTRLFGTDGVRWLHTGGIFAALSDRAFETTLRAVREARTHGAVVSFDVNYRPSLWRGRGGPEGAAALTARLLPYVDVLIGGHGDFTRVGALSGETWAQEEAEFEAVAEGLSRAFPSLKVVATTRRAVRSASRNDWSGFVWTDGRGYASVDREGLEVFDRVGGGDGFASGLIYALLQGLGPQAAVDWGAAHGALAMTTPGDVSMADRREVEALVAGVSARTER